MSVIDTNRAVTQQRRHFWTSLQAQVFTPLKAKKIEAKNVKAEVRCICFSIAPTFYLGGSNEKLDGRKNILLVYFAEAE